MNANEISQLTVRSAVTSLIFYRCNPENRQVLITSFSHFFPNPFNPVTTINYGIPTKGRVVIDLYSTLGEKIKTLADEQQEAGSYSITFHSGNLASGVYLYRVQFGTKQITKRMLLVK